MNRPSSRNREILAASSWVHRAAKILRFRLPLCFVGSGRLPPAPPTKISRRAWSFSPTPPTPIAARGATLRRGAVACRGPTDRVADAL